MLTPKKNRTLLERALVGLAGEHYVLYQLHMKGMLASLAPTNAPTVDILMLNEDKTIAATIQVKTRTYGPDGGWHMKKKHETLKRPSLFYVFVDLGPETPSTFVVPSTVVTDVVRDAHKIWLKVPGKNDKEHKDNDMRRILPSYKYEVPIAPPAGSTRTRTRGISCDPSLRHRLEPPQGPYSDRRRPRRRGCFPFTTGLQRPAQRVGNITRQLSRCQHPCPPVPRPMPRPESTRGLSGTLPSPGHAR